MARRHNGSEQIEANGKYKNKYRLANRSNTLVSSKEERKCELANYDEEP